MHQIKIRLILQLMLTCVKESSIWNRVVSLQAKAQFLILTVSTVSYIRVEDAVLPGVFIFCESQWSFSSLYNLFFSEQLLIYG